MEEILNNWLQEKPKDKFDKELHKYTYYDLMEFAEHYHTLQLQQTGVIKSVCKHCKNQLCDSQTFNQQCFKCEKKPL